MDTDTELCVVDRYRHGGLGKPFTSTPTALPAELNHVPELFFSLYYVFTRAMGLVSVTSANLGSTILTVCSLNLPSLADLTRTHLAFDKFKCFNQFPILWPWHNLDFGVNRGLPVVQEHVFPSWPLGGAIVKAIFFIFYQFCLNSLTTPRDGFL